jgi:hypothetical protein
MSLPPVTTAQQPNNFIITTAVNSTGSTQTPLLAVLTRRPGLHAKLLGFDWKKRSDQTKYLIKSGLPVVHAAIVNDDWDLALELINPDDFGLLWLPPVSQSAPKNGGSDLDASTWTIDLLNKNESIRNDAILQRVNRNRPYPSLQNILRKKFFVICYVLRSIKGKISLRMITTKILFV